MTKFKYPILTSILLGLMTSMPLSASGDFDYFNQLVSEEQYPKAATYLMKVLETPLTDTEKEKIKEDPRTIFLVIKSLIDDPTISPTLAQNLYTSIGGKTAILGIMKEYQNHAAAARGVRIVSDCTPPLLKPYISLIDYSEKVQGLLEKMETRLAGSCDLSIESLEENLILFNLLESELKRGSKDGIAIFMINYMIVLESVGLLWKYNASNQTVTTAKNDRGIVNITENEEVMAYIKAVFPSRLEYVYEFCKDSAYRIDEPKIGNQFRDLLKELERKRKLQQQSLEQFRNSTSVKLSPSSKTSKKKAAAPVIDNRTPEEIEAATQALYALCEKEGKAESKKEASKKPKKKSRGKTPAPKVTAASLPKVAATTKASKTLTPTEEIESTIGYALVNADFGDDYANLLEDACTKAQTLSFEERQMVLTKMQNQEQDSLSSYEDTRESIFTRDFLMHFMGKEYVTTMELSAAIIAKELEQKLTLVSSDTLPAEASSSEITPLGVTHDDGAWYPLHSYSVLSRIYLLDENAYPENTKGYVPPIQPFTFIPYKK